MKGSPDAPRCGYSLLMVEILNFYGLQKYKYIDVFENPIIREQVRLYSKWPTYPQLFIDGELVGGSDVVNEMHHDDSLRKLLVDKKIIDWHYSYYLHNFFFLFFCPSLHRLLLWICVCLFPMCCSHEETFKYWWSWGDFENKNENNFFRLLIVAVLSRNYPLYKQCNPVWENEQLETSTQTICSAGCLMSSAVMTISGLGHNYNPSTFNVWLK